jgi:hypothetical protein
MLLSPEVATPGCNELNSVLLLKLILSLNVTPLLSEDLNIISDLLFAHTTYTLSPNAATGASSISLFTNAYADCSGSIGVIVITVITKRIANTVVIALILLTW